MRCLVTSEAYYPYQINLHFVTIHSFSPSQDTKRIYLLQIPFKSNLNTISFPPLLHKTLLDWQRMFSNRPHQYSWLTRTHPGTPEAFPSPINKRSTWQVLADSDWSMQCVGWQVSLKRCVTCKCYWFMKQKRRDAVKTLEEYNAKVKRTYQKEYGISFGFIRAANFLLEHTGTNSVLVFLSDSIHRKKGRFEEWWMALTAAFDSRKRFIKQFFVRF